MEIYLAQQTVSFLFSIALGAALGVVYDAFRISRIALPTPAAIVAAEDIVFFLLGAVTTFLFLLGSTDGKIRFFLLAGELIGAVLYFCTLSLVIMGLSRRIIAFLHAVTRFIIRYLILPIWRFLYWIVSLLLRPLRFFIRLLKKLFQKVKFSLKKWRILLYNQKKSALCHIKAYFPKTLRKKNDNNRTGEDSEDAA